MKTVTNILYFLLVPLALEYFPLLPEAYAGDDNTATGNSALASVTTGSYNTADGVAALVYDTTGSENTAVGDATLSSNTTGNWNSALGSDALFYNVTGTYNTASGFEALYGGHPPLPNGDGNASYNTADGAFALLNNTGNHNTATGFQSLYFNTNGASNTADGAYALFGNTGGYNTANGYLAIGGPNTGNFNTASGYAALYANTTGASNTAVGANALNHNQTGLRNTGIGVAALALNTTGSSNTATGFDALGSNTIGLRNTSDGFQALANNTEMGDVSGSDNTATGFEALFGNTIGAQNTAIGEAALKNNINGHGNTALGFGAGYYVTGNLNIDIGHAGMAGESNTIHIGTTGSHTATFIAGISGVNEGGTVFPVYINSNGRLGTQPPASSRRFKKDIEPMNKASEAILAFRPVTFHYKSDKTNAAQFGLIAEEVSKINPDLVVRDEKGEIYSVRYDQVNAMLLNEFLKDHRKVEQQQKTIAELKSTVAQQQESFAQQQAQIEVLTSGLQKVSAQIETRKDAPRIIANR